MITLTKQKIFSVLPCSVTYDALKDNTFEEAYRFVDNLIYFYDNITHLFKFPFYQIIDMRRRKITPLFFIQNAVGIIPVIVLLLKNFSYFLILKFFHLWFMFLITFGQMLPHSLPECGNIFFYIYSISLTISIVFSCVKSIRRIRLSINWANLIVH